MSNKPLSEKFWKEILINIHKMEHEEFKKWYEKRVKEDETIKT